MVYKRHGLDVRKQAECNFDHRLIISVGVWAKQSDLSVNKIPQNAIVEVKPRERSFDSLDRGDVSFV